MRYKVTKLMLGLLLSTVCLQALAGQKQRGIASWYSDSNCHGYTAANTTLKKGTVVKVTTLSKPHNSVIVKIADWGPAPYLNRIIDLCPQPAKDLGLLNGKGLTNVEIRVLSIPSHNNKHRS